jgi:hypothetical protein
VNVARELMVTVPSIEAIVAFSKRYPIFPCARETKRPLVETLEDGTKFGAVEGFYSATQDEELIRKWWQFFPDALVAIPTGSRSGGLVVIDWDEYKNDPASSSWAMEHSNELMSALIDQTRRHGKHYYFCSQTKYKSVNGPVLDGIERKAIDVKAEGGYVIAWRLHGARNIQGEGEPIPQLPHGLIDELVRVERAVTQMDPTPAKWQEDRPAILEALRAVPPDIDRNRWRDIGFALHRHSGATPDGYNLFSIWSSGALTGVNPSNYEGEASLKKLWNHAHSERDGGAVTGIGTLFRIAAEFGYRQPKRYTALTDAKPPAYVREAPPSDELIDKDAGEVFNAGNVRAREQQRRGQTAKRSSPDRPSLNPGYGQGFTASLKLRNLSQIMASDPPPREFLFRDVLPAGAFLMVGRPKIGKSWLLYQLALCVVLGKDFLGFEVMGQWDALYIAGEDDDTRMKDRFRGFGMTDAPANFETINMNELEQLADRYADHHVSFAQFIDDYLTTHPQTKIVVIDTETTCRQIWGNEAERDSSSITRKDYAEVREFDKIALNHQAVIVLVNHTSKRRNAAWIDIHELINRTNTAAAGASGSIVLADPPDADPLDETATMRVLGVRGRDVIGETLLAVEQDENRFFHSKGTFRLARQTRMEQDILECLEEMENEAEKKGEWHVSKDIAEEMGLRHENVKRCISRMTKARRVQWKTWRIETKKKLGTRLLPLDPAATSAGDKGTEGT